MIIVIQDKETIVNFNNIVYIDIEKNTFEKYVISAYFDKEDSDFVWLGAYETKERAKDVLQEIIEVYKHQTNKYHFTEVNNVYEMPEV